jgi:hypothetical protein
MLQHEFPLIDAKWLRLGGWRAESELGGSICRAASRRVAYVSDDYPRVGDGIEDEVRVRARWNHENVGAVCLCADRGKGHHPYR